jgi:hypothetical protein
VRHQSCKLEITSSILVGSFFFGGGLASLYLYIYHI